jgi:hypothetical protein
VRFADPLFRRQTRRVVGASTFELRPVAGIRIRWGGPDCDGRLWLGAALVGHWEIRPGDVVWFAPGEKHCMATPTTAMTHFASGSPEWQNGRLAGKVSDEQYRT